MVRVSNTRRKRRGLCDDKQRQDEKERDERKGKNLSASPGMKENPIDPFSVLPLELISLILQYRIDMKSIIALERVSKQWSKVLGTICTPAWVVGCWGVDVDWCRNDMAALEGRTDWQRFKAEVKSCHNMKLGFPESAVAGNWVGATVAQGDYFACLKRSTLNKNEILQIIRHRSSKLAKKNSPVHKEFGKERYSIKARRIFELCGFRPANDAWSMDFFATGPENILLFLEFVPFEKNSEYKNDNNRPRAARDDDQKQIICCISTKTAALTWARSAVSTNDWYYPASKRTGPIAGRRSNSTPEPAPPKTQLVEKVFDMFKRIEPVPHSNSPFCSYQTGALKMQDGIIGCRDIGEDSLFPSTIRTIDLRTGDILEHLSYSAPCAAYLHMSNIHFQNSLSQDCHSVRHKLFVMYDTNSRFLTASVHDLFDKVVVASCNLKPPPSIIKSNPNRCINPSKIEISTLPPNYHGGSQTIFVTTTSSDRRHRRDRAHHISWTLQLENLAETSGLTLKLVETNVYFTYQYGTVKLNPRARIGMTTSARNVKQTRCCPSIQEDVNGTLAIIAYFEDYNRDDDDEAQARIDGAKIRHWNSDTLVCDSDATRKLMLLAPETPQDREERKKLEDAKSKEIAALGWEYAERSVRQEWTFDEGIRVGPSVLQVRDGCVVLEGTAFWF